MTFGKAYMFVCSKPRRPLDRSTIRETPFPAGLEIHVIERPQDITDTFIRHIAEESRGDGLVGVLEARHANVSDSIVAREVHHSFEKTPVTGFIVYREGPHYLMAI